MTGETENHGTTQGLMCLFSSRAVLFSAFARLWQLVAAVGTMVLMTFFFSRETQGYYTVILSLIAIQMIFDLGLNGILMLLTSHEWAQLRLEAGTVEGKSESKSRIAAIHRFGCRWSKASAVIFVFVVTPIGLYLLSDPKNAGIPMERWVGPWICSVLLNAVGILVAPKLSILEGCHQVLPLHRMRILQSMTGSIVVWTSITCEMELWTIAVSTLVRILFELHLVEVHFRELFRSLVNSPISSSFSWRVDIWPLQWRLSIQSIGSYFSTTYIVPVTFRYQGEFAAGQVGFTWQMLTAIQSASLAWIQTHLPRMGSLIASGRIAETERDMLRSMTQSVVIQILGIAAFFCGLIFSDWLGLNLSSRFLPTTATLVFALGFVGLNLIWGLHIYVRLFRKDPFLLPAIIQCCLMTTAIQILGQRTQTEGLATAFAAIVWLFGLPAAVHILRKHRAALPKVTTDNITS